MFNAVNELYSSQILNIAATGTHVNEIIQLPDTCNAAMHVGWCPPASPVLIAFEPCHLVTRCKHV